MIWVSVGIVISTLLTALIISALYKREIDRDE